MANRKQILLLSTTLLLSGLLLGVPQAYSEPVALNDRTMDEVTAGEATGGAAVSGGVVVGQTSEAVANRTAGLVLNDEAQQNANGLNIVNSTESAVANVVNVWDGSGVVATEEENGTNAEVKINQINNITQEQVRSATLSEYVRSEADHRESLNRSGSAGYSSKFIDYHSAASHIEETRTTTIDSNGKVNTLFSFQFGDSVDFSGHLGLGIAAAGYTDIEFTGGSTDIGMGASLKGQKVASVTAYAGEGRLFYDEDTKSYYRTNFQATGNLAFATRVELPTVKLVMNGAGCGVAMGSCNASSKVVETMETNTDNHTLDIFEVHLSGYSSFSEVETSTYRSPFELKNARAEYIVVDDSTLELNSDVTLELSDSAQRDAKGMNIVNAIGSNVANGTNVSRTTRFEGRKATLVLNQFNTVNHGH